MLIDVNNNTHKYNSTISTDNNNDVDSYDNKHNLGFKSFSEYEIMAVTITLRKYASLRFDGISSKLYQNNKKNKSEIPSMKLYYFLPNNT